MDALNQDLSTEDFQRQSADRKHLQTAVGSRGASRPRKLQGKNSDLALSKIRPLSKGRKHPYELQNLAYGSKDPGRNMQIGMLQMQRQSGYTHSSSTDQHLSLKFANQVINSSASQGNFNPNMKYYVKRPQFTYSQMRLQTSTEQHLTRDIVPAKKRLPVNGQQREGSSQSRGRQPSTGQVNRLKNLIRKGECSTALGGARVPLLKDNQPRKMIATKNHIQQKKLMNKTVLDANSISGAESNQQWRPEARQHYMDLTRPVLRSRDGTSSSECRRYRQSQQYFKQFSESKNQQNQNAQAHLNFQTQAKFQNSKSIGIFDLQRQLNKNTKRVLSSKNRFDDDSSDVLMMKTYEDPGSSFNNTSQHNIPLVPLRTNGPKLNQSNSGVLDSSVTYSNNNHYSQTKAATSNTTKGGPSFYQCKGLRNTIQESQSQSDFNSLDQENKPAPSKQDAQMQQSSQNTQFKQYLREQNLDHDGIRRQWDRGLPKFVKKTNTISSKDKLIEYQKANPVAKHSLSPKRDENGQEIASEGKSFGRSKRHSRKLIDASQLLADVGKQTTVEGYAGQQKQSIGEKLSLAGALDTVKIKTTVDDKSKHYSLQSESAADTYSSKQYKVNPLLLDDKVLQRIQQAPPSETAFHLEYSSEMKNKNQRQNADSSNEKSKDASQIIYPASESGQLQSFVLQLEPKTLQSAESRAEEPLMDASGKKQLNHLQQNFLKIEDLQSFRNEEADTIQHPPDVVESSGQEMNQSYVLQTQLMPRPVAATTNFKQRSASQKRKQQASQAQPHKQTKNEKLLANTYNELPYNQQKLSKQNKTTSISSTNYRGDGILRDSYRSSPPKKFLSSRSALLRKKNLQQNVLTSDTLPEEYRNMNTWDENVGDGQLNDPTTLEYSQILQESGINGMSRIKRSNLHKIDRQNFNYQRVGAAHKQQSQSVSSGNFHHDQVNLRYNKQLESQSFYKLKRDSKNTIISQNVAPRIITQMNQNNTGLTDKESNLKSSNFQSKRTSMQRDQQQYQLVQQRGQAYVNVQSRSHTGRTSPERKRRAGASQRRQAQQNFSASQAQLPRCEEPLPQTQEQDADGAQNILDIRIPTTSAFQRSYNKFHEHRASSVEEIGQKEFSSPPARHSRGDIQNDAGQSPIQSDNPIYSSGTLSLRKIKYKSMKKGNLSDVFETMHPDQQQHINVLNHRKKSGTAEKSEVLLDAQVAALNYVNPKRYQSVMQSRPPDQPSMREYMQRQGARAAQFRPNKTTSSQNFPQFAKEVQKSAENYSTYAKNLYKTVGSLSTTHKRPKSAKAIDIRGLRYKFKVVDIQKYTNKLKYGIFNWPVRYTSIGRRRPNPMETDNKLLAQEIHFDTLLKILQETDWKQTPLYEKFREHGRWINNDEEIYSEVEINYLSSTLHQMDRGENNEEFDKAEGQAIIEKHWSKTMTTLQRLMSMMNMLYYFEKIKLKFKKLEEPGTRPRIDHLEKLLSRCKKLYNQIDSFMKIFKLIEVKEKRDQLKEENDSTQLTEKELRKDEVLINRLITAICLLLKEHPVLPVSFNFGEECLLEKLKGEREFLKHQRLERENNKHD